MTETPLLDNRTVTTADGRTISAKSAEEGIRAALAIYHGGTLEYDKDADNDPYCRALLAVYEDCRIMHDALGIRAFCDSDFWQPSCVAGDLHRLVTGDYGQGRLMDIHFYFREWSQTAAGKRMGLTPKMAKRILADYPVQQEAV